MVRAIGASDQLDSSVAHDALAGAAFGQYVRHSEPVACSTPCVVEVLQELMGGKFDVLVAPFCRPVLTCDQSHPMDAPEVAIYECVSRLGVVVGTVGESEMPFGVFIPRVRL